jgi:hypothetical protein
MSKSILHIRYIGGELKSLCGISRYLPTIIIYPKLEMNKIILDYPKDKICLKCKLTHSTNLIEAI